MEILALADFHYAGAGARSTIPTRRGDLVPELLASLCARETGLDVVIALGDLVENGLHPGAAADLAALRDALCAFGVPVLAVPGNHDRDPAGFARIFGAPEPQVLGRVRLVPFADRYDTSDVCTRDFAAMERRLSGIRPDETAIVCQHSAILPKIDSEYPYTPPRHEDIARAYRESGVALSLSGHYHRGIPMLDDGGVRHLCVPALCEAPFSYVRLSVDGLDIRVRYGTLA